MLTGAHVILYSTDAEADRAFLRDVLALDHVDAGGGWLIFALPPAEVAVHPTEGRPVAELYLMTDEIGALLGELDQQGVEIVRPPNDEGWGILASIRLPSGAELPVYEPRHPTAIAAARGGG